MDHLTERASVQAEHSALVRLRELILRGTLKQDQRLFETDLADRLGLSRTPVRQALPALAQEGLLVRVGKRGYAVRRFTREESVAAVHLRALLEGHAARLVTLAGRGRDVAAELEPLLADGDALLAADLPAEALEEGYGRMNVRFHAAIVERSGAGLLGDLIARCNVVPFAAPGALAFERREGDTIPELLRYAHRQHHAIVDALRTSDGARVEMLLREHAAAQEGSIARAAPAATSARLSDGVQPATSGSEELA